MFHEDKTPSFSVIKFDDGHWRFKCFGCGASGDPITYIQRTAGMSFIDAVELLVGTAKATPVIKENKKLVKSYDYYDENGVLLYQVQRFEPKTFRQRRPDGDTPGKWIWDMCGVRRVLFRLPALLSKEPATTVYYVEGEKDVECLEQHGLVATTHAGGSNAYRRELLNPVSHLRIVVVPDNDDPGKQLMRRVWSDCRNAKMQVGFLLLPTELNGKPVKDSSDYFEAGGTREAFEGLVK